MSDDTEFDAFVKLLQDMKEIDKMRDYKCHCALHLDKCLWVGQCDQEQNMRFDYIGEDGKCQTFETRSGLKIVTHYVYPPIPDRRWDWQAVFEDYEPGMLIGEGATEEEAKMDLLFQYYDGGQHG